MHVSYEQILAFARDVGAVFIGVWIFYRYFVTRLWIQRWLLARRSHRQEDDEVGPDEVDCDLEVDWGGQPEQVDEAEELSEFDEEWKSDPEAWRRKHGAE